MRVTLGDPQDQPGDLVILPAKQAGEKDARTVLVAAPRWRPPSGPDRMLAQVYRDAMEVAQQRRARSLVLPSALVQGSWPLQDVTRIALTVLMSTPSTVRDVTIAVPTVAVLELWAEALVREP